MELLQAIRQKITARQYEYSKHAVDQSIIRHIGVPDVEQALLSQSELVEDYPDDNMDPVVSSWDSRTPVAQCMFIAAIRPGRWSR